MGTVLASQVASSVAGTPLNKIDVSQPHLFRDDTWGPWFERLRREDPVHYLADSQNGAFWSVTSHDLVMAVDTNHHVFSSEVGGIAIVDADTTDEQQVATGASFISMDEPRHGEQRRTVSPTVAPPNLANLEPIPRRGHS